MKKSIKNKLMLFFVCALMLVAPLAFMGMNTTAKAADTAPTQEQQVAIDDFKTALGEFVGVTIDATLIDPAHYAKVDNLLAKRQEVSNKGAQSFLTETENKSYDDIRKVYEKALSVIDSITVDMFDMYAKVVDGSFRYSEYITDVKPVRAAFTALTAEEQAYVDYKSAHLYNLTEVEKRAAEIETAFAEVEAKIIVIQAWDGAAMTDYKVANTAHEIVVASEPSIVDVETALTAIYGTLLTGAEATAEYAGVDEAGVAFIDGYTDVYCVARAALNALYTAVDEVEALIAALDAAVVTGAEVTAPNAGEVLYTLYDVDTAEFKGIAAVNAAYTALDNSTNNDLQSKVENIALLNAINTRYTAIQGEMAAVTAKIDLIPAYDNILFTQAHKDLIDDATEAFALLSKDIVDADNAAWAANKDTDADYLVDKCLAMKKADKKYNDMKAQVEKLVADLEATVAKHEANENIRDDFNAITADYNAITAEQKTALNATVLNNTLTWLFQYNKLNAFINSISAIVGPVEAKIGLVLPLTVSLKTDFTDYYFPAKAAYDDLKANNAAYVPYVSNGPQFELIIEKYENLLDDMDAWIEKVALIQEPVTANNMGLVADAKATFEAIVAINPDIENVAKNDPTYKTTWEKYDNALKTVATFEALVADAVAKIDLIPDTLPAFDDNFAVNVTAYANAVADAETAYALLAQYEADDYYFEKEGAQYADKYAEYQAAIVNNETIKVEAAIVKITEDIKADAGNRPNLDINDPVIVIDDKKNIDDAEKAYNALSDEKKLLVRNYDDDTKVDLVTYIAKRDVLFGDLDNWVDAVANLINITADDISATADYTAQIKTIWGMDLTYFTNLNKDGVTLPDNTEIVPYSELIKTNGAAAYLQDAKALLDMIEAFASRTVIVSEGATDSVDGVYEIVGMKTYILSLNDKSSQADIQYVMDKYNALHATQQALVDAIMVDHDNDAGTPDVSVTEILKAQYNKVTFANAFKASVEKLQAADKTLGNYATALALQSLYVSADEILQEFAKADYETLLTIINAYKTAELISISEVKAKVEAVLAGLNGATVQEAINAAETAAKEAAIAAVKGNYNGTLETLKTLIDTVDGAAKKALEDAVIELEKADDLLGQEDVRLAGLIDALQKADEAINVAIQKLDEKLTIKIGEVNTLIETTKNGLTTELNNTKSDLNGVKATLESAKSTLEAKDVELAAAIEAANKALNDAQTKLEKAIADLKAELVDADAKLQASIDSNSKTTTIITIIFSIAIAGLVACVLILFIKRKA